MVKIYLEGGGNKYLDAKCRKGFHDFFEKAGLAGRLPKVIPCGGRTEAYKSFSIAVQNERSSFPILLVDSETAVEQGVEAVDFLRLKYNWCFSSDVTSQNVHLMVQVMEAWFLADKDALVVFYGSQLRLNRLSQNQNVESIRKEDVLNSLVDATRETTKGRYTREHSFEIIGKLTPEKVRRACSYADRLLVVLAERC